MDAMLLALRLVFPLCVYMVLGYGLQKKNFFSQSTTKEMNNLVFKVLLPLNVIKSIYGSNLRSGIDWSTIVFCFVSILIIFILCWITMPFFSKDKKVISVMIQGIFKSNYILLATSMAAMLYGEQIGMAGVLVAVVAPLTNILSAITFELYRGEKIEFIKLLKKIILNPLVCSAIIGIVLSLSEIKIPDYFMNQIIGKLSGLATPIALIMMGATFDFSYINKYQKELTIVTLGRLLVVPLLELPFLLFFKFRGVNLMALLLCASTPTAVNSYSTALSMGGDGDLAGAIVAITSILSIITMFIWLFVVSSLGLL